MPQNAKILGKCAASGVAPPPLPIPCETVTFEANKNDDQLLGKCNKVADQNAQVAALAWGAKCQALSDKSQRGVE